MQQAIHIFEKWAFEWEFRFSVDKYKKQTKNLFFLQGRKYVQSLSLEE